MNVTFMPRRLACRGKKDDALPALLAGWMGTQTQAHAGSLMGITLAHRAYLNGGGTSP